MNTPIESPETDTQKKVKIFIVRTAAVIGVLGLCLFMIDVVEGIKYGTAAVSVRGGHFIADPDTTFGEAIDASFSNGEWTTYKADNGREVVKFTGKVTRALFEARLKYFATALNDRIATADYLLMIQEIEQAIGKEAHKKKMDKYVSRYSPETGLLKYVRDTYSTGRWATGQPVKIEWEVGSEGQLDVVFFALGADAKESSFYPAFKGVKAVMSAYKM